MYLDPGESEVVARQQMQQLFFTGNRLPSECSLIAF
jgi:hypothetical protein